MPKRTPEQEAAIDNVVTAAEKGYDAFASSDSAGGFVPEGEEGPKPWKDLTAFERFGVLTHTRAIVIDPYADLYPSFMKANHDQKAYQSLDDHLRDALGYSKVNFA